VAFDYKNMIIVDPQLYAQNLAVPVVRQKLDALTSRLIALPGTEGVAAAAVPPLGGRLIIESLPGLPPVYRNSVTASYFSVLELPIVRGRAFFDGEQNVVVVSESAARSIWPNEDPVGKTWHFAGVDRTVSGVVKDSGANLLAAPDSIEAYLPLQSGDLERAVLILHSRVDPALLARRVARSVNDPVAVSLMRASRENLLEGMRKTATLLGSIGLVATVLAATGMFALVAFAVAQRKRELGIRMAIGAQGSHILAVLLLQNVKPMIGGAVAGVVLAIVLSRLVGSFTFLPKDAPLDVTGFAAGLVLFAVVAALATISPALRALRIDPYAELRQE
jgi:ABC-type antimicrobial peptide transport system permease subunit